MFSAAVKFSRLAARCLIINVFLLLSLSVFVFLSARIFY